jgi:hypothetical protein
MANNDLYVELATTLAAEKLKHAGELPARGMVASWRSGFV